LPERPRVEEEREEAGAEQPFERALRERLRSLKSATERRTVAGLARELGRLPTEAARTALEVSASVASVSLRAGVEFLRAAPGAARVLDAQELRAWGEMGRRLAMADAELGANFFAAGVAELEAVARVARPPLFQVCARQMTLSSSVALETFRRAPELAGAVEDAESLRAVYEVAVEIARRSAKHSSDFLNATPRVAAALRRFDARSSQTAQARRAQDAAGGEDEGGATNKVERRAVGVAGAFAARAGGIASEMWSALPNALDGLDERAALRLLAHAESFLERGGAAALHALVSGGEVLRSVPEAFNAWAGLLHAVGEQSNAGMVALARSTPQFFRAFAARLDGARAAELARRVIAASHSVAQVDAEAAISCFRSGPQALAANSIEQFEQWAAEGLRRDTGNARARRSYFALETRQSNESLHGMGATPGLALEEVAQTLRLYVEALTGHAVDVAPLASVPDEARIGDGRTIHLPATVSEFSDDALDFRLYKVLAAHAAGQIEFGTHARETPDLRAAHASLAELYAPENRDALDAFALDGYINDPAQGERVLSPAEEAREAARLRPVFPADGDYRAVLMLFPQAALAARIFGTLENGRIDRRLRLAYRGLARDLDLVRAHLRARRPRIASIPITLVPFELLFQITLCGGARDDARSFYGQIVSELETIVSDYLMSPRSSVADTLMATSRVYTLFQSVVPEITERHHESNDSEGDDDEDSAAQNDLARDDKAEEEESEEQREQRSRRSEQARDARELFNAWASAESLDPAGDEMFTGAERWASGESPEQELEEGEVAYNYDEWDRELSDHRTGWCRVVEKTVGRGDRSFVDSTRARYRGVISSIRHQFQLMKPESLKRVANELDGDDYDLNAVIDYIADRRSSKAGGGHPSERLYTKRLRRERDVAVSFLLDQSSSTARTIGRHPLQPYTHPGRRIIEVEKEGLVLMSEALDAVGDPFSIYGFTSEGRRNVKFYIVKDFDEQYTDEVERRIGGINYQHNTRLGAAVRHASARLLRQEARTRLLIVLSDGRPYDHDYGDARYAREDTREALRQARADGVTPFCITIDRDSETELRDLYGEVGYTIIDDVLSLPERLPAIYRRLTT
jgi:nitric oxide reductase activation protein